MQLNSTQYTHVLDSALADSSLLKVFTRAKIASPSAMGIACAMRSASWF